MSHDLHSHSWISDGSLSPADVVDRAAAAGVRVLALTDHDDTAGIDEARTMAARLGNIDIQPGVEISVTWQKMTIHIVALQVDVRCAALQQGLERLREFRNWRAGEMGRRLARCGIAGIHEEAMALSRGRIISRTHFARVLVQRGHARDMRDVFRNYLKPGKPGHVPGEWASLEEALDWIRAAGGVAVVAHPARYDLTNTRLRALLGEFGEHGGKAMEVISGSHSADDIVKMARHAREMKLFASSGSDFHSPENSWAQLGRLPALPADLLPVWVDWEAARV